MHSSTASLTAFLLCVLAMCAAVQSLGGRVFQPTGEHKDDKFVTDPSANVPGKIKISNYCVFYVRIAKSIAIIAIIFLYLMRWSDSNYHS